MKKTMLAAVCCLLTLNSALQAGDREKPIAVRDLPVAAQEFLQKYFDGRTVAFASVDSDLGGKEYEVSFTERITVEFDRSGNWTKVECRSEAVPDEIIPAEIRDYVRTNYPDVPVRSIQKDRHEWDVELGNGIDLEFDRRFRLVGYDH